MSVCSDLKNGYSIPCINSQRVHAQRLVLINKSDVEEYIVERSSEDIEGNFTCRHNLLFKLKAGKKGFSVKSITKGLNIFGSFSRAEKNNIIEYGHLVQLLVMGFDLSSICFLQQLDKGFYFAALLLTDGSVIIYGFENGLNPVNYKVDIQNTAGGTILSLQSDPEEQEDEMPFLYKNLTNTESEDFDNLFEDIPTIAGGDFNNDFNNDFFI